MNLPPAKWRLVVDSPHSGPENMAIDEAILEAVHAGLVPPTLRLYAWDPPCLSLGYSQPAADVDLESLRRNGWDLVRRPTGGRAILHTDEITYSVVAPEQEPRVTGGVLESYQRLSQALLAALHFLQTPAISKESYGNPPTGTPTPPNTNPVCFEIPSNWEITIGGKKLIGSAQSRRKGVVLQHGSLPLEGDLARIITALAFQGDTVSQEEQRREAATRLLARATTLKAALEGRAIPWAEASEAIISGFTETLHLELVPGALTDFEQQKTRELLTSKFTAREWTFRI